jgi:hypothetical protein
MASIRDTLTKLLASDKPEPGTPLARAVGQYPFQQGEAPLEAPMLSPDDLIGTGIGKAALVGAGKAMPLLAGTFIGPKSKLWNVSTHKLADALEKQGVSPERIWHETGMGRGLDNRWRQEISDEASKTIYGGTTGKPVNELMSHDTLFQAYPELKNVTALTLKGLKPEGSLAGTFIENKFTPSSSHLAAEAPNEEALNSVTLHELQHAIQHLEGFAKGGSPKDFPSSVDINDAKIISNLLNKGKIPSEASKWVQDNLGRRPSVQAMDLATKPNADVFNTPSALNQYKNLAGEAEARLTQNRAGMNEAQRRMFYPFKQLPEHGGLDINPNEAIVKGLMNY